MTESPLRAIRRVLIATVLPSLALAACNKAASPTADNAPVANNVAPLAALPATVPLTNDMAATPLASAPAAAALPTAPAPRVVRLADPRESYAYADRAAAMSSAVDAAPPDYAFDYDGVQPWAWHAYDGSTEVVEPVDGGYRYYYYQPGASRPYLIRDPNYAYGYDDGDLAAVYGPDGQYIPPEEYRGHYADHAGRYLLRGAALIAAAATVAHYGVSAGHWRSRRTELAAEREQWQEDQQRQADWRAYHDEHAAAEQGHWEREQAAREDRAARFDQWQRADFRGPPPGGPADDGRHSADAQRQRQDQLAQEQDAARREQTMHDQQQQRQMADQRAADDRQARADRLQRDNDQRSAERGAEADRADRQQATARDADARQQAALDRQQAAAQRQQAAEQRQRADFNRPPGADRRGPDAVAFGRGDRDRQGGSFVDRDDGARAQEARAADQEPAGSAPPARFTPRDRGSPRPAPTERRRDGDDNAAFTAPRPRPAFQPKPESGHGEPRQDHPAVVAHNPSADTRASARSEAGREHGHDHHDR